MDAHSSTEVKTSFSPFARHEGVGGTGGVSIRTGNIKRELPSSPGRFTSGKTRPVTIQM
jgi:hypothetical protein